ncbi:SDR family NAD(P)-dependent oxidoreductase [Lacibacterium aquatile]|uniref:SDR family NAD(P)-dependent oxidoreductase n=1 Tax=Lacibacterium aquatile TaxID=1168082 RepID=A0ABW5DQ76_9PROT
MSSKAIASQTGRTWLILGATSPIARAFARHVAEAGGRVLLAGRDTQELARIAGDLTIRGAPEVLALPFDAADMGSHAGFASAVKEAAPAGSLDIYLGFGVMPEQTDMEADPALALSCIAGNYSGAVSVLLHLAPHLEAGHQGRVVVVGSVAGDRGRLKNHIYGSAKAGLATFAAGLRNRLNRSGVTVTTVKPGFLDTGMTWGLPGIFLAAAPEDAARAMLKAALKGKEVVYVPFFWELIMLIIKSVPEKIFKKLAI